MIFFYLPRTCCRPRLRLAVAAVVGAAAGCGLTAAFRRASGALAFKLRFRG